MKTLLLIFTVISCSAFEPELQDTLINDRIHSEYPTYIEGVNLTTTTAGRQEKITDVHIIGVNKYTSIIKRPDYSITPTDNNYGIYMEPDNPTTEEVNAATWVTYNGESVGILLRGSIIFENLTIDCNMGFQTMPSNKAQYEHSSMIGFAGRYYNVTHNGTTKKLYIGFKFVEFRDIRILNRGFSDAIWIGRGYFRPHIEELNFTNIQSYNNINQQRADIGFSGLVENANFYNITLDKIEAESNDSWLNAPATKEFMPAKFTMLNVSLKRFDFASKGQSLYLLADNLRTSEYAYLYQVGGHLKDCIFFIDGGELRRMNRMSDPLFETCIFYIKPHSSGVVNGLRPEGFYLNNVAEDCNVRFLRSRFIAVGNFTSGRLIETTKTNTAQKVNMTFDHCEFDERFTGGTLKLALLREKGTVKFIGGNVTASKIDNSGGTLTTLIIE